MIPPQIFVEPSAVHLTIQDNALSARDHPPLIEPPSAVAYDRRPLMGRSALSRWTALIFTCGDGRVPRHQAPFLDHKGAVRRNSCSIPNSPLANSTMDRRVGDRVRLRSRPDGPSVSISPPQLPPFGQSCREQRGGSPATCGNSILRRPRGATSRTTTISTSGSTRLFLDADMQYAAPISSDPT